jgi:hypothetical protein
MGCQQCGIEKVPELGIASVDLARSGYTFQDA